MLAHPPSEIDTAGFAYYVYLIGTSISVLAAAAYPNHWAIRVLFMVGSIAAVVPWVVFTIAIGIVFFGLDPAP